MAIEETELAFLPSRISSWIFKENLFELTDIQIDLYKPVCLVFGRGVKIHSDFTVTDDDIRYISSKIERFDKKNRGTTPDSLVRVSRILDWEDEPIGFTVRIGRSVDNLYKLVADLLDDNKSILVVGRPGSGKTTFIRAIAKYVSEKDNTIVVDYGEIGGVSFPTHECLGNSRVVPVRFSKSQGEAMIEAVENHTPETIIVDELSDRDQALAARSIAMRGVRLVATVHGDSLDRLMKNPPIKQLLGVFATVTLSDSLMMKNSKDKKSVIEQVEPPSFDAVVVIRQPGEIEVYLDAQETVHALLENKNVTPEVRRMVGDEMQILQQGLISSGIPFTEKVSVGEHLKSKQKRG
jgi:stage III sporulation protein SpoIIIAA